ncbi:hypothetical protein DPEC_G00345010 [Dallia pectoralis]|uniref:Uncharacterized protein n=1 Tax=Dallia pectoralis TaxID=75939 RepID=A0ACC2F3E1_DALPE|nr:hypothetical protein DPEC_G00345010 [Dallia pectoralis]
MHISYSTRHLLLSGNITTNPSKPNLFGGQYIMLRRAFVIRRRLAELGALIRVSASLGIGRVGKPRVLWVTRLGYGAVGHRCGTYLSPPHELPSADMTGYVGRPAVNKYEYLMSVL